MKAKQITPFAAVQTATLKRMKLEQATFAKNPNSQNWTTLLVWMMAHQQLTFCSAQKREMLGEALYHRTMDELPEAICQWLLGMSVDEAIR